ncbi:S-formylglutathione hydrolase FrmB [Crossiella equi]|uniref:S-formylglutathione hydrolase FrmB n=1 Tax=Crossiella equi TaxID=130796 RepID=A0ABS5AJE5_9PSEU|nr:alpha/beta hydrolase family protein [Crossiella equi]MBP2476511.1 S-formylglutathione hydrolase FrmB [Crossiella equi]
MHAERWRDQRIVDIRLESTALRREIELTVLVPGNWHKGDRDWPVLHLLHGAGDDHTCWLRETDVLRLTEQLDLLVVQPPGGRVGLYSDWLAPDRMGTIPHWDDFHFRELPHLLEKHYRANRRRIGIGVSMGGYGVVRGAQRHPGFFQGLASFSGLLHTTRRGMPAFTRAMLRREGEKASSLWSSWEHWQAEDPFRDAELLRGTSLYLATGDGRRGIFDRRFSGGSVLEWIIGPGTVDFAARLAGLGIPATLHTYSGTHTWPYWRRELETALPILSEVLRK